MTRIWWILIWALKILKIFTLIGSFCAKYITFDLKNFDGILSMKSDAKFGEELSCCFKIDTRSLTNFDPGHSKV